MPSSMMSLPVSGLPVAVDLDPPMSLDPREPPPASPRPGARTPTRKTTPLSSRTGSPNPASRLHLPLVAGALFASGPGSVPPSPTNLHSSSVHSREEDSTSAIFERDIEHAITSSPAMLPSTPSNAGNISPSPSSTFPQLTPTKSAVSSHSHHLHHPQARASVTDSLFPTVLDDAVEALSSGSDVLVVSPSRTGSPTSLSVRKPYSPSAGMVGSRETSPGSPGTRSPVRAGSVGGVMLSERERRSSAISLTGQAGKMLDSAAEPSQGFRLTLPGDDHPTFVPTTSSPPTGLSPASITSGNISAFPIHPSSSGVPGHPAAHRLSFISPQDLIVSPPLSTHSLSSITSGASVPSPHTTSSTSQSPRIASSIDDLTSSSPLSLDPFTAQPSKRVGSVSPGEDEWEKEGLGKGLEERLENLLRSEKAGSPRP